MLSPLLWPFQVFLLSSHSSGASQLPYVGRAFFGCFTGQDVSLSDSLSLLFTPSSGLVCRPSHLIILTAPSIPHLNTHSLIQRFNTTQQLSWCESYGYYPPVPILVCVSVPDDRNNNAVAGWHVSSRELWLCPHRCWELFTAMCRGTYCIKRLPLKAELWSHLFNFF